MSTQVRFSRQEERVLTLALSGLKDPEIATSLGVGIGTVRTFWKRIRAKSGGRNRAKILASLTAEGPLAGDLRLMAETAARRQAEAKADILDRLPVPVAAYDETGECVYANAASGGCLGSVLAPGQSLKLVVGDPPPAHSPYETAFREVPAALAVLSTEGRIELANLKLAELLGSEVGRLVGGRLGDRVPATHRDRYEQAIRRTVQNGDAQCSLNLRTDLGGETPCYLHWVAGSGGQLLVSVRREFRTGI